MKDIVQKDRRNCVFISGRSIYYSEGWLLKLKIKQINLDYKCITRL